MVAEPTRGAAAVSAAIGAPPVEIWIVRACTFCVAIGRDDHLDCRRAESAESAARELLAAVS